MSDGIITTDKSVTVGVLGPMKEAWTQTFLHGIEQALGPCLVIVWHREWMYPHHGLWNTLLSSLQTAAEDTQILVIIFGDTPDDLDGLDEYDALKILLRALAQDSEKTDAWRPGWASISSPAQFRSACVKWRGPNASAMKRLCTVVGALETYRKAPPEESLPAPTLCEFFQFLSSPDSFRTKSLHDSPKDAPQGLRMLKWLASVATMPRSAPLMILLVENRPGTLKDVKVIGKISAAADSKGSCPDLGATNDSIAEALGCLRMDAAPLSFLSGVRVYLVSAPEGFEQLRSEAGRGELERELAQLDEDDGAPADERFRWDRLDLVLQDIVLDDRGMGGDGLALTPFYFDACPQALVFVLTSLDVESLVGSGDVNWRFVDCIISKTALATLWYEYQRCFCERFGRMFWFDWVSELCVSDRKLLRGLFGSLRRWQIEPDILWHGQNLPEMIDHADRHIRALWQLANKVIGTLLENGGGSANVLSLRRRVAFAVAIWMHDVGHRGDEYIADSMDIRASHAGISERLLLRNPGAYTLGWLMDLDYVPAEGCRPSSRTYVEDEADRESRLECRNAVTCTNGSAVCLLREIGLLCRHHQSNAPLDDESIWRMAVRGKAPSLYSLVPDDTIPPEHQSRPTSERFLGNMSDQTSPLPSPAGTRIRTLSQFQPSGDGTLSCLAGLLRMLDALQLHRSRVGTSASIESFREFLDNRCKWCKAERRRLVDAMRAAVPGTKAYSRAMSDLDKLGDYELVLTTQHLHYWRQSVVYEQEVQWRWMADGCGAIELGFVLSESALSNLKNISSVLPDRTGPGKRLRLDGVLKTVLSSDRSKLKGGVPQHPLSEEIAMWTLEVQEEVVRSEHRSQYSGDAKDRSRGYLGVLANDNIMFRIAVLGTDHGKFEEGEFLVYPE